MVVESMDTLGNMICCTVYNLVICSSLTILSTTKSLLCTLLPLISNLRSLCNKLDEHELLVGKTFFIFCFVFLETWLFELMSDSALQLASFHLLRVDDDTELLANVEGGGVFLLAGR